MQKPLRLGLIASTALAIAIGVRAGDEKGHSSDKNHVMVRPDDVKWGPAPPSLPAGASSPCCQAIPSKPSLS